VHTFDIGFGASAKLIKEGAKKGREKSQRDHA
jgi:hypothetical protein